MRGRLCKPLHGSELEEVQADDGRRPRVPLTHESYAAGRTDRLATSTLQETGVAWASRRPAVLLMAMILALVVGSGTRALSADPANSGGPGSAEQPAFYAEGTFAAGEQASDFPPPAPAPWSYVDYSGYITPPRGMVLIPAGTFEMGDHHDGMSSALPLHEVTLSAFYMDRYEVTNARYAAALNWAWAQGDQITVFNGVVYQYDSGTSYPYCDTTTSSSSSRITWNGSTFGVVAGKEDHPMVRVSWYGAAAYANWRSRMEGKPLCYDLSDWSCNFAAAGYRLPTEAEWEYAARGGLHNPYRRYPWGDALDGLRANYWVSGDPYETGDYPWTTPVGYYAANGYGLYDTAGNVWEWGNDWYVSGYPSTPQTNPTGPVTGIYRVVRGGGWIGGASFCRCAYRANDFRPHYRNVISGFRLALDSE